MSMPIEARFDRLDQFIAEGRIARGAWGHETRACPIRALVPELRRIGPTEGSWGYDLMTVPQDLMPVWIASLTVAVNDNIPDDEWGSWIARYSQTMRRTAGLLNTEDWSRVFQSFLLTIVEAVGRGATPLTELQTQTIVEIKRAIEARKKYAFAAYTSRVRDLTGALERAFWKNEDRSALASINADVFLSIAKQFAQSTSPHSIYLFGHRSAIALYYAAGHPKLCDQCPREGWGIFGRLFLDIVEAEIGARAEAHAEARAEENAEGNTGENTHGQD